MTGFRSPIVLLMAAGLVCSGAHAWEIKSNGVDGIVLGKPLPAKVLKLPKTRISFFIADGVPFKGYKLTAPPVSVALKKKKVSAILIESGEVTTKLGVGVGSTLGDLEKAYGEVPVHAVPPTLGDDEAAASTAKLKNVFFYFKDVKDAKAGGAIKRIMLFKQ